MNDRRREQAANETATWIVIALFVVVGIFAAYGAVMFGATVLYPLFAR